VEKGIFYCSSGNTVYYGDRVALVTINTDLEFSEHLEHSSIVKTVHLGLFRTFFLFLFGVSSCFSVVTMQYCVPAGVSFLEA